MFISYAQNFEDVMLWRALKNIEKGFYIDIGAQDPVVDSVSLAFYEQGWRGVHLEPVTYYAEKLRDARPDETVIQAAVGRGSGVLSFFEIIDTGLSTGNAQIAEKHAKDGFAVRETVVPFISLDTILDKYQERDIHWLKIDVEGMEAEVLQGWQPSYVRPWIVVVESTLPTVQIETFKDWEPLLLSLGYEFVCFDGLNRFYVSKDKQELKLFFKTPPNVFDGFVLSGTSSAPFCSLLNSKREQAEWELNVQLESGRQELQRLSEALAEREREIDSARLKIDELDGHAHHLWMVAENLNNDLQTVFASSSWRVTAPMRFTVRSVKWFGSRAWAWLTFKPGSRPRRVAKRVIRRGIIAVKARPGLKRRIIAVAYRLGMYPALSRFYYRNVAQSAPVTEERSAGIALGTITEEVMTPWTRHMGSRLKAARTGMKREEK